MNTKTKTEHHPDVTHVADTETVAEEPCMEKKPDVPGQQLGLYNKSEAKDVKQMVTLLNNPGEDNQSGRG